MATIFFFQFWQTWILLIHFGNPLPSLNTTFTKLCPAAAKLCLAVRRTGMTKWIVTFWIFPKVTKMLQLHLSLINDCTTTINEGLKVMAPWIYRVSQEERAKLREGVPYVKLYRYNPKHLCPKLNGYGDKVQRKVWSFCGSTYCTWFPWHNTHTLRIVCPCLQLAQARSSLRLHM